MQQFGKNPNQKFCIQTNMTYDSGNKVPLLATFLAQLTALSEHKKESHNTQLLNAQTSNWGRGSGAYYQTSLRNTYQKTNEHKFSNHHVVKS